MKKFIFLGAIVLGLGMLVVPGAASAHETSIRGTTQCRASATSDWTVTWTIVADQLLDISWSVTSPSGYSPAGSQSSKNNFTRTASYPASQAVAEEAVVVMWSDGQVRSPIVNVARPPVCETPITDPPVTNPPVTDPPVTNPPVTDPPVTNPPVTNPPVTDPPVTNPPVTEPPVTDVSPPVTDPPVTSPPVTNPPVTNPPITDVSPPVTDGTTPPVTDGTTPPGTDNGPIPTDNGPIPTDGPNPTDNSGVPPPSDGTPNSATPTNPDGTPTLPATGRDGMKDMLTAALLLFGFGGLIVSAARGRRSELLDY